MCRDAYKSPFVSICDARSLSLVSRLFTSRVFQPLFSLPFPPPHSAPAYPSPSDARLGISDWRNPPLIIVARLDVAASSCIIVIRRAERAVPDFWRINSNDAGATSLRNTLFSDCGSPRQRSLYVIIRKGAPVYIRLQRSLSR